MFDGEPDGTTPIDLDEAQDLIPTHLHTRDELNSWEQANILTAAEWVRKATAPALNEVTIRSLHRRMFDETWGWAGRYRTSDKTIGVFWADIPVEVKKFVDDGLYWIDNESFSISEAALRLHHRLVVIHPFVNGNGRHARLWCDLLLSQNGGTPFQWRAEELDQEGDARARYIAALRHADGGDFAPLLGLFLPGE